MTSEQFQARVRDLALTAGTPVLLQFGPSDERPAMVADIGDDYSWFDADVMAAYMNGVPEYKRRRITPDGIHDFRSAPAEQPK